ncbi:MAG: hypothetical protein GXC76_09315 [Rhodanobacteraceae bacterium]|jgi:uncharacterized membrane protein YagU involved in acid resistance|nr:hypothetical protein [Rhodanobacteraceae bacterium]
MPSAILAGGAVGGALDLVFAFSFAGYNGVPPGRLLQIIASGLLGNAAFAGGVPTMALGFGCHFGLSLLWAALFAAAAWRVPGLARRPLLAGAVFGVVVFLAMRLVVLPLSAYPRPVSFAPLATTLDLLSHMLLFGGPIALAVARALRNRLEPSAGVVN